MEIHFLSLSPHSPTVSFVFLFFFFFLKCHLGLSIRQISASSYTVNNIKRQQCWESLLVICSVLVLCLTSTACSLSQTALFVLCQSLCGLIFSCFRRAYKKVRGTSCTKRLIIWRILPVTSPGEENGLPKCALINNLSTQNPWVDTDAKTNWNLLTPSPHLWIPSDSWDCFCSVRCWGGGFLGIL